MIKINALVLGKIENTNDYLVFYTRKLMVMKLSELIKNIGSLYVEREGNDNFIIQFYNCLVDTNTGNVKYEDGVSEDKHWVITEDNEGYYEADNKNVMVLGRVGNKYLMVQPKGNKNIVADYRSHVIAGYMQICSANDLQHLNEKLKNNKLRMINAKVVSSKKKSVNDKKQIVYVQSFSGGIHYLIEGEKTKLSNIEEITTLLKYLITLKACKSAEYIDNLTKVYQSIEAAKENKIKISYDKLHLVYEFIQKGLSETDEKIGILTVDWSEQLLKLVNWGIELSKQTNVVNRYATVDSIVQSIGKRCASAVEESPKQSRLVLTGKNVQYFKINNFINNDKNLVMMAILRFDVAGETKYLLTRIVRDSNNSGLTVQVYVTESDKQSVLEHKTFDVKLENMDATKASVFCKRFKIKFSETILEALRVLHK